MSPGDLEECPHLGASVKFLNSFKSSSSSPLERLLNNPQCDDCGHRESNLWLCLFPECYSLGCSSGLDHSTLHQVKRPDHVIQLNINTRRIWCYGCNKEVAE